MKSIVFTNLENVDKVISAIKDEIRKFGRLSVATLDFIVNGSETCTAEQANTGWTSLEGVRVEDNPRRSGEYILSFPEPERLFSETVPIKTKDPNELKPKTKTISECYAIGIDLSETDDMTVSIVNMASANMTLIKTIHGNKAVKFYEMLKGEIINE